MTDADTNREWFEWHDNLVTLTSYMARTGHDASEVAYAVEKPWKFIDLYNEAVAEQEAELNAEAAVRDTAEVTEALDEPVGADDPCPAALNGQHSWEPDADVLDSELRSGMGIHCVECSATAVYDKHGDL